MKITHPLLLRSSVPHQLPFGCPPSSSFCFANVPSFPVPSLLASTAFFVPTSRPEAREDSVIHSDIYLPNFFCLFIASVFVFDFMAFVNLLLKKWIRKLEKNQQQTCRNEKQAIACLIDSTTAKK